MIGYIGDMAAKGQVLVIGPHKVGMRGFYAQFKSGIPGRRPCDWDEVGHALSVEDAVAMAYKLANNIPVNVPLPREFR